MTKAAQGIQSVRPFRNSRYMSDTTQKDPQGSPDQGQVPSLGLEPPPEINGREPQGLVDPVPVARTRRGLQKALEHAGFELRYNTRLGALEYKGPESDWKPLSNNISRVLKVRITETAHFTGKNKNGQPFKRPARFSQIDWDDFTTAIAYDNATDPFLDWVFRLGHPHGPLELKPIWAGFGLDKNPDARARFVDYELTYAEWGFYLPGVTATLRAQTPGAQARISLLLIG